MALDLKCRKCGSENTQRLTIMRNQQSYTGLAGQTGLAAALKEPQAPWGYLIGFLVGIGATMFTNAVIVKESVWPALVFLACWFGIGTWMHWDHRKKLEAWQDFLDSHFICLRCGEIFEPIAS